MAVRATATTKWNIHCHNTHNDITSCLGLNGQIVKSKNIPPPAQEVPQNLSVWLQGQEPDVEKSTKHYKENASDLWVRGHNISNRDVKHSVNGKKIC